MHEDLTGTGTECSPRDVCTGDPTGCTECPDTKFCVENILSGASVSVGGAWGAASEIELTHLRHDCIERPGACAADDCECLSEYLCFNGSCSEGLPAEYSGVGNLVEVSEGGAYCYQYDG
jgi:hypothetical protein